jgi:tetratricopeptide (TPR) repeat protein
VRQFWDTYRAASQKRSQGDLDGAIGLYEQALRLKPDHEDSLYYLGNSYFARRRFSEAKATYERLLAVNRLGSSRGYIQLALLHAELGAGCRVPGAERPASPAPSTQHPARERSDLEKAAHYFQQALAIDPDSGALLGVGEVALLRGARAEARRALLGVNAENASCVAAPYLLGYLAWKESDDGEAWRWFRLAVKRCKVKKPPVPWSEEGDVKADPELRWLALARQSVFGSHWLRLRRYLNVPDLSPNVMEREYSRFERLALSTVDS